MRLKVYEIANRSLKEVYLAATLLPKDLLLRYFSCHPPEMLSHWKFDSHHIAYFEIERGVPESEVAELVEAYDRATPMPGWTIHHAWREGPRSTI